jgi:hypothetical protein
MRFLVLTFPGDKSFEQGSMPDQKVIATMMKFNEELSKAGILLALDGLHPTSKGARVRFAGGKRTVTDGPFTEAKEIIGGYWLWQVKSKEEAVAWASRCPLQEGDVLELRQIFDMADVGEALAERWKERPGYHPGIESEIAASAARVAAGLPQK